MDRTTKQSKILKWLSRVDAHSAGLYEAAIKLMADLSLPCRGRFVAHAYREICSSLFNRYSSNSREDLGPRLDKVAQEFRKLELQRDDLLATDAAPLPTVDSEVIVPRSFTNSVRDVVDLHSAAPKGKERARAVFAGLASDPSAGKSGVSQAADRWFDMYNYFVRRAHDRVTDDKVMVGGDFEREILYFEDTLLSFVDAATGNLDALDEFLEQANA